MGLLINAKTKKNERVSLNITYVIQQHSLIDNVNVEYLGENEEYLKTPICDVQMIRVRAFIQTINKIMNR